MSVQLSPDGFQPHSPWRSGDRAQPAIECELDCQRTVERIAALAGCLEGSEEEVELALLVECYERWEARRWLQ